MERIALVEQREQVLLGGRVELPQERQDPLADQAALRAGVRRVRSEREADGAAVALRLLTADREQRAHDAVGALRLDPGGRPARDEAVEDGLDLVRARVARGAGGRSVANE